MGKFNRGTATCAIPLKNNRKVLAYPPQAGYVRAGIIEIDRGKKFIRKERLKIRSKRGLREADF